MSQITLDNITVKYATKSGDEVLACQNIDLQIQQGEFVTIIGPSGCGKSTLLHIMGGLLSPTSGEVKFEEEKVQKPNPHNASFVFQDYSLFPWKSVVDNVAAGMRFNGVSKRSAKQSAEQYLDFVGLKDFAEKYPRQLSGGMQQRVAIARALSMEPKALLMDEPFGALDEQTRRSLGLEMSKILEKSGQTVVLITHSLDEAIFWADRIVVMSARPGQIAEEIIVEAPRPRSLDFMTTKEFQDIRVRLFKHLEAKQEITVGN